MHTVTWTDPRQDEPFLFVSLDGEHYIGVTRLPKPGEEAKVRALFEGTDTRPMTVARRLFQMYESKGDRIEFGRVD